MAMDSMMKLNQSLPRMSAEHKGVGFSFINIDENSYREWGEPFHTPRDKLLSLIKFAVQQGAGLIAVDIDLSGAGYNTQADVELAAYLKAYQGDSVPPLLLLRTFYPPSKHTNREADHMRPFFFPVEQAGQNVFWAQPLFKKNRLDQYVRHWHLLQAGCDKGKPRLLPSFQLVSDAFLHGIYAELQQAIVNHTPHSCEKLHELKESLNYAGRKVNLDSHGIGERLMYTLPWPPHPGTTELTVLPANKVLAIAERCQQGECVDDLIRGRIIVIGASHAAARDSHVTPLGYMPGAMIIVNAIKSFYQFGQITPPPGWAKWGLEFLLIVLMAWAFARFSSMLATVLTGLVIMSILMPVSFYFFKFGIWIDFALPVFGMQLHQMVAQYEEEHAMRKQLQAKLEESNEHAE
ncbi:CHASE2 domain protein [Candidatus Venteria ishoeyi]|uniref:CHASE2 domain protein n=2 Tax=Candidatus Venteria ishoeyi TaxID=1899563 RepID=A0A1H6F699_9GAMM|nr:CHASE2 domain protein [Candidatus Venteria ishoeyi]